MKKKVIIALALCIVAGGLCAGAGLIIEKNQVNTTEKEVLTEEMASGLSIELTAQTRSSVSGNDVSDGDETEGIIVTVSDGDNMTPLSDVLSPGYGGASELLAGSTDLTNLSLEESEYSNLAIANVQHYVNVRSLPSTEGEIVGKIYSGAVAQILSVTGEHGDWFEVISGDVKGYISAEYFIYGEAAAEVIDEYITRYAQIQVSRLNVRKEPSTDSERIGYVDQGEKIEVLEDCGEWLRVQYTDSKEGYIAAEYVQVAEEFSYAESIEEERARLAAQKALAERAQTSENSAPENTADIVFPETTYTSNEELRKAIVEYAMQYLGNSYVHGGRSLSSGTDCSGFTCYIYADFGYSISRTPSGQYSSAGRSISYEDIQPGDIICYSANGSTCSHVGLYIGDGQIIHAANSRKGVIISSATYDTIISIRNVID